MARHLPSFLNQLAAGFAAARVAVGEEVLLAVSGGADSIALLHSTVELWGVQASSIVVGHVNHNLRGAESQRDEEFVGEVAAKLGVRFQSIQLEAGQLSNQPKVTLEEAARNSRYDWLTKLAVELGTSFVVTAHHADDQAETVLHNIIRGTGLRGLGGMRSSRDLSDSVSLIRPLLMISRDEIELFLKQRKVGNRTDASNHDVRHTRNAIRQRLIPTLRDDFNPRVVSHLVSLSTHATNALECLDEVADKILKRALLEESKLVCRLSVDCFADVPVAMVRHVFCRLWIQQGWPRKKMKSSHWNQLQSVITSKEKRRFQLPGPVDITVKKGLMRLELQANSNDHSA